MSAIFSGLLRLKYNEEEENRDWDEEFTEKDITNCRGEKNGEQIVIQNSDGDTMEVVFAPYKKEWEEEDEFSVEIFSKSEKFCLNANKQYILEKCGQVIPRIFYTFRPSYGIQLSVRFVLQLITGTTDRMLISHIIANNKRRLARYFSDTFILMQHITKGGIVTGHLVYNEELIKQILFSIIELFNLQRGETGVIPVLALHHLVHWGCNISMFNNETEERQAPPGLFQRGKNREICMYSAEFACVVCNQHFDKNTELKIHIEGHTEFACLACKITCSDYNTLLVHKLTFCRAPCLTEACLYCHQDRNNCSCVAIQNKIFKYAEQFVLEQGSNLIYSEDMFSVIFHYLCTENELEVLRPNVEEDREEAAVGDQEVEAVLVTIMPQLTLVNSKVAFDEGPAVEYRTIKADLGNYFQTYKDVEAHMLEWLYSVRHQCIMAGCKQLFTVQHVKRYHPICAYTVEMDADEIPYRFASEKELIKHYERHSILAPGKMGCNRCDHMFSVTGGMLSIKVILEHIDTHKDSEMVVACERQSNPACFEECPEGALE